MNLYLNKLKKEGGKFTIKSTFINTLSAKSKGNLFISILELHKTKKLRTFILMATSKGN